MRDLAPATGNSDIPRAETVTVSIVMPAYDEEAGLGLVLERLFSVLDGSYEVIVVDDGSTDTTAAIASQYPCRLVRHERNRGKGRAVKTGIAAAQAESVIVIDADHTYPIEMIPTLARSLVDYDIVSGSRIERALVPPLNRFGNWLLRNAIRRLYGSTVDDPLTGFYAARRHILREMHLSSEGFGIEAEIVIKAARMGLRVLNLPVTYRARKGKSKLNPLTDGYLIMRTILGFLALYNPTITFILPGLLLLLLSFAVLMLLMWHPVQVGGVQFSYDTMIVAATMALLGAQITVFGLASNLYACRYFMAVRDRVTALLLHRHARAWLFGLGLSLMLVGVAWGTRLLVGWTRSGFGIFTRTSEAIFVSFLFILGVQMWFSLAFLGLFMGAFSEDSLKAD